MVLRNDYRGNSVAAAIQPLVVPRDRLPALLHEFQVGHSGRYRFKVAPLGLERRGEVAVDRFLTIS